MSACVRQPETSLARRSFGLGFGVHVATPILLASYQHPKIRGKFVQTKPVWVTIHLYAWRSGDNAIFVRDAYRQTGTPIVVNLSPEFLVGTDVVEVSEPFERGIVGN